MTSAGRRGAHLLDAVVEVVADMGLGAVSMRSVAAAAGVSLAQVQYYFRSKDELLAAAFEHISDGVQRRAEAVNTTGPPREVLRRLLHVWLPLDEIRARDARGWLAFTAAAATSATLRAITATTDRNLRGWFAGFLRAAPEAGELDTALDVDAHAAVLLAVVDGLVIQALVAPSEAHGAALAVAGLDAQLSQLFIDDKRG